MFQHEENFRAEGISTLNSGFLSSGKPYHKDKSKRELLGKGATDGVTREGSSCPVQKQQAAAGVPRSTPDLYEERDKHSVGAVLLTSDSPVRQQPA
jgi:hypothetical protein